MTRVQIGLAVLLLTEFAIGGYWLRTQSGSPSPPSADFDATDTATAEQLRTASESCRSAGDWSKLADQFLAAGFFPQAEACYRQAVALEPSKWEHRLKHGFALERLGLLDEANQAYQVCIDGGHSRADDLRYYQGCNFLRMNDEARAMETFTQTSKLPASRFHLARVHLRNGRIAEARALTNQLAEEFPQSYSVTSLQYRLTLADGSPADRATLADQFPRKREPLPTPFDTEVKYYTDVENKLGRRGMLQAGVAYLQAGQFAKAADSTRAALNAGWSPEIADCLAESEFALGQKQEAVKLLFDAVNEAGPSFILLWRLGQGFDAIGSPDRALAAWERAERVTTGSPNLQELQTDLANRYEQLGQREKAKRARAMALMATGINAVEFGKSQEAERFLRQSLELDAKQPLAWFYLGEAYRFSGKSADARNAYDECIRLDPNHGRARRALELL